MVRSKASSTRSTQKSSCDTTFSRASHHTDQTNITSYSQQDSIKRHSSRISHKQTQAQKADSFQDEGLGRSSASSVNTYASTEASDEDISSTTRCSFPKERRKCFDPDAIPSTPADFAELFPTARRIMIQHDDSTPDGNMNLRVDTDVITTSGRRRKMTLFHLKMKDLQERQFSLRRYCRSSGREVASCKRQYVKPLPSGVKSTKSGFSQSPTASASKRPIPERQDSGYHSEDEDDEFMESLQALSFAQGLKATIPTDSIRLEFSNYAQVVVEPRISGHKKQYDFEYWGEYYTWRKRSLRDGDEHIKSYELVNLKNSKNVASIVPDALSPEEIKFETSQGAWIPASSMRILQKDISDDLGDVIIATGLIALTDDCIPR